MTAVVLPDFDSRNEADLIFCTLISTEPYSVFRLNDFASSVPSNGPMPFRSPFTVTLSGSCGPAFGSGRAFEIAVKINRPSKAERQGNLWKRSDEFMTGKSSGSGQARTGRSG